MRLYDLIQRLEAIRDRMESTFTNEFLKGEVDNLVDELKKLSPEIGKVVDNSSNPNLWTYPGTTVPPITYYPSPGSIIITTTNDSFKITNPDSDSGNINNDDVFIWSSS